MNKQELIERIEGLKNLFGNKSEYIEIDSVIRLISELDEPEKVTIPQFVADWIKHCRGIGYSLHQSMTLVNENVEIKKWFLFVDNQDLFARAWLDGYEVEKEKWYRISMPKARNHKNHAQILCEKGGKIFWCGEWYPFRTKFTKKQLEQAGFGWVFDCPGIEIEEVE